MSFRRKKRITAALVGLQESEGYVECCANSKNKQMEGNDGRDQPEVWSSKPLQPDVRYVIFLRLVLLHLC
jgi:hypothetical protein